MINEYNAAMLQILLIGCFSILLIILILVTVILFTNISYKNKVERLSRYQINTSANIDQSIPAVLSLIIQDCFIDYQTKYLILNANEFINTTKEAEIRKDLAELVSNRISDATIEKLSLLYNPANIGSIIADKIYITVMNYVAEHNAPFMADE